jgi:MerR family transcriptional regulator, copper efflux regulator
LTPYRSTGRTLLAVRTYTIGSLARAAGVSVETVRFYERRGLVDQPPRRGEGYRQYPDEALERLRFIRRAKCLGFTLGEIRELLVAAESGSAPAVLAAAVAKVEQVDAAIAALQGQRARLRELAEVCADEGGGCVTLAPCAPV